MTDNPGDEKQQRGRGVPEKKASEPSELPPSAREIAREVAKLFPIRIQDVSSPLRPVGAGPAGTDTLDRIVASALQSIMRVPRIPSDANGIAKVVFQATTETTVGDRTVVTLVPGYDVGAISAGPPLTPPHTWLRRQAMRAADAIATLRRLGPIECCKDPQEAEAIKEVIEDEIGIIRREFEAVPRPPVVKDALDILWVPGEPPNSPGGELPKLQELLGLKEDKIQTLEEYEMYWAYRTLEKEVRDFGRVWYEFKTETYEFKKETPVGLAAALLEFSQRLDVVRHDLTELEEEMDWAGLPEVKRRILTVYLQPELVAASHAQSASSLDTIKASITLQDGLEAIRQTTDHIDDVVKDAGKVGLKNAAVPKLASLQTLAKSLQTRVVPQGDDVQPSSGPPPVTDSDRVAQAFNELIVAISDAYKYADALTQP